MGKYSEIKNSVILDKQLFPTIDLSILEKEAEENNLYQTSYVYIKSAAQSNIYCRHDKDLHLQVDYLNFEKMYLDFFETIIVNKWPCYRIIRKEKLEELVDKNEFIKILQRGLREEFAYKDQDIPFDFILQGIDCIIHVGFDLGLLLYYSRKTSSVKILLKQFYGAGFCIE